MSVDDDIREAERLIDQYERGPAPDTRLADDAHARLARVLIRASMQPRCVWFINVQNGEYDDRVDADIRPFHLTRDGAAKKLREIAAAYRLVMDEDGLGAEGGACDAPWPFSDRENHVGVFRVDLVQ